MKDKTKLIATGRPHKRPFHPVNPQVERASTYLFPTYDDYLEGGRKIIYGRLGGATHRALEDAVTALEGGFETRLAPSGLQAVNASLLAFVKAGDRILITDSAYDPTRKFCERFLARFGVETVFYDPRIGEKLSELMTPNTKVVFAESPGSLTFEVQDIPALASVARKGGAKLVVDNTWSGGVFMKPLTLGADVVVHAGTKYLSGHSDCLIGTITSADEETAKTIYMALLQIGSNVSADDAYLTLRGMRTLHPRMKAHEQSALLLSKWLAKRPEVECVLHPALKSCPGMRSGSAIFQAHPAYSASFSSRSATRRSKHSSMRSAFSAWDFPGAALKAFASTFIPRRTAPRPSGLPKDPCCVFMSGLKIRTI